MLTTSLYISIVTVKVKKSPENGVNYDLKYCKNSLL